MIDDPPSPWAHHASHPRAGEAPVGVAVFQHSANPGYPARTWTLREYGFLGAAWPGERSHAIEPGESLELRYRLFVHRGTAEEADVAARHERYLEDQ